MNAADWCVTCHCAVPVGHARRDNHVVAAGGTAWHADALRDGTQLDLFGGAS